MHAVERARLQAENARARYERGRVLAERTPPLISVQDFADLKTAWEVAESNLRVERLDAEATLAEARTLQAQVRVAEQRVTDSVHRAPIEAAHYPADEIARQLDRIHQLARTTEMPGKSISFGTAGLDADHVALPSFTFSMNSLSPGEMQRPHQHNAVAVTLIVQGERCYSMIDQRRVDWQPWTVMITPPAEMHSHHNDGDRLAQFLIVQDGGLHYHARTMGFSY